MEAADMHAVAADFAAAELAVGAVQVDQMNNKRC